MSLYTLIYLPANIHTMVSQKKDDDRYKVIREVLPYHPPPPPTRGEQQQIRYSKYLDVVFDLLPQTEKNTFLRYSGVFAQCGY